MSGADSVMKALAYGGWGGIDLRINPVVKRGTVVQTMGWGMSMKLLFHCEADRREWIYRLKSTNPTPRVKKGRGQRRNRRNRR